MRIKALSSSQCGVLNNKTVRFHVSLHSEMVQIYFTWLKNSFLNLVGISSTLHTLKKNIFFPHYLLCVEWSKVCGVDLRDASHEQAVEAIRRAGDCVDFLVQSGQQRSQVLHLRKTAENSILRL